VKVTIVPRGQALGAAWYQPHERSITTKEQLLDEMCSTLGGRAAEELTFGKISSGALNDLERNTKLAYSMIAYMGMSKEVGNLSFYDSSGRSEYQFQKPYSDKTGELIDEEVKKMIEEQYIRAKKILTENKEGMTKLAELLLENEVIYYEDAEKILGKRVYDDEYEEEIEKVRQRNIERFKKQQEAMKRAEKLREEEALKKAEKMRKMPK
jgi:ATP-dependent Zn protease